MKRLLKIGSIVGVLLLLLGSAQQKAKAQPGASVSLDVFYDELSPYGQWIDDPEYGYVWVPNVSSDFRPYYSGGHWALTEYGNMWVSDYPWGWAPFHYGRWTYDSYYGWIWVPGYEWGPAWVSWRDGGGYYGWAPLTPGISVSLSFGPRYYVPNDWWVFIPCQHLYRSNFYSYYRGPRYNGTIINRTTIINNTNVYNHNTIVYGPRRGDFERRTGQRPMVYNVREAGRPQRAMVQGNNISVFHPRINETRNRNVRPQNLVRPERPIERRPASAMSAPQRLERGGRGNINGRNEQPRMQPNRNEPSRQMEQMRGAEMNRMQQQNRPMERRENVPMRDQQQRIEERRQEHWDRQQTPQQRQMEQARPQRMEAPQQQQRFEQQRMEQQRSEQQQRMQQQRMEQQRSEQQQRMQQQRMEQQRSEQQQRMQQQRFEQQRQEQARPQRMEAPQQQRFERPQQQQRFEQPRQEQRQFEQRPQRMEAPQQMQRPDNPGRGGGGEFHGGGHGHGR